MSSLRQNVEHNSGARCTCASATNVLIEAPYTPSLTPAPLLPTVVHLQVFCWRDGYSLLSVDGHERGHPIALKAFHAVNGNANHNFLCCMLLDQQCRRPEQVYAGWNDIPSRSLSSCRRRPDASWCRPMIFPGLSRRCTRQYTNTRFLSDHERARGNKNIAHRVGVWQGCPPAHSSSSLAFFLLCARWSTS